VKKHTDRNIVFIILGAALLFNQVGLNFFHDRHDAHEFFAGVQKHQTILLKHGEHCQVCSLEVLFNIVLPVETQIPQPPVVCDFEEAIFSEPVFIFLALSQGRAPPFAA
jgi:hypothetical protein